MFTCLSNVPISIIRAFVTYMLEMNANWKPEVTAQSPEDVCLFITKKCGPVTEGCEGKKVFILHLSSAIH